jgi:NAD(P)-dependent dehydrogenase (short-subunit alcohol dehydrogenase family)
MMEAEASDTSSVLSGRTALVTGGTRGLGHAIALALAEHGASVVVSGRRQADVDRAVSALAARGGGTEIGIAADLVDLHATHQLAQQTLEAVGKLDILVNNAGMSIRGNFWDVTDAEWEEQVAIDLRAPFVLAQYAARNMIEHGTRGRIVNVGTIGARRCHRDACVYDSAKGGIEVMTRNMAYELAPYGISVNCVVPGAIPIRPGKRFDESANRDYLRHVPLGRFGQASDIVAAALYFVMPGSAFTTGQSLLVDGGHATYLPQVLDRTDQHAKE